MAEMESGNPVVSVEDVTILQNEYPILHSVNFKISRGEFVFLVGRTGSGKSSLLKMLYADLPLIHGSAQVTGYNLEKIKEREIPFLRRKLGIIFQDFQLFPDRSVAENLFFVMKATGWKDKTKMKNRLAEVLMNVGLGASEKKYPHQLSGGEQQRAAIARALINEPLMLLADEPTGNLDPEVSVEILKLFKQINRSGTAVLMATHSYGLIKKYSSRVLKCDQGRLLDSEKDTFELREEEYFN
ncbi:MAG: cell division ATP-binding protein FtsE [Cyclobacteriaceae bacterium]